jgi:hypothetical protein
VQDLPDIAVSFKRPLYQRLAEAVGDFLMLTAKV